MSARFDTENSMNVLEDEQLWSLLSAYVDGETTPAEAAVVEAHLRSDAAYAQDFAFLKAASRQVIQMGDVEPPTQLREAIFAATVNKPTLHRRLAQAMGQLQAAFLPRYALPTGALAAGVVAAFLLMPKTADTKSGSGGAEPPTVANKESSVKPNNSVVTPQTKAAVPTTHMETQKTTAQNNNPQILLPTPPQIDWEKAIAPPMHENIKADKKITDTKLNVPRTNLIPVGMQTSKSTASVPKIQPAFQKTAAPMPKPSDMYNDTTFSPVPNMDRGNQRTIVRKDPPTELLPGDDVTPTTTGAAPMPNATGTESVADASMPKTLRLRSGRTLPDSRRIATAAQFRSEESEFQKGISRNTMLAMQRDELSGSTVTRF